MIMQNNSESLALPPHKTCREPEQFMDLNLMFSLSMFPQQLPRTACFFPSHLVFRLTTVWIRCFFSQ